MRTVDFPTCTHEIRHAGRFGVMACSDCATIEWFENGRPVDPEVAMAGLFGDFDLVATLPTISAPASDVLMYRPARRVDRTRLEMLPSHTWLAASPTLWLSHDGEFLLLAPLDRLLLDNLTRRG